ncbi:hypothetical protein T4A_14346 [Trichinella pseudospiralis]|uniref:Uncharacterized protein n=1 Tax=Trichinella pseudospiralis TaxID=6337 RepID=A0A0V0XPQ0_TRIPS|nr:hypothetical protein T4E_7967 [Trichinella pseudospiralis]KRY68504.1 hypothetical protein T4A_14346 [Trichinella pseudospiralis]KRZ42796.1 hypothetical protein T4C_1735 [Trichinella pseudospiralis]
MAQILKNIRDDIWNVINDESRLVGKLFGKVEQKIGKSCYQVAVMLAIRICMLLTVSPCAGLLCNFICVVHSAIKALTEMESNEKVNSFLCGGKMAGSYDWFLPWDGLITLSHSLASGRFTASS